MKLKEKIEGIQYNISGNPAKEGKLANATNRRINPADLGDYIFSAESSLPGYRGFWTKVGKIGGYLFSRNELDYLSTHPIEVFTFMEGFDSPRIAGSVELNKFYD